MIRALALLLVLAAAACAPPGAPQRSASDVDKDRAVIAQALKAADSTGVHFHVTHTISVTGGDVPQGQALQISATADGVLRSGSARMSYKIAQGGNKSVDFDIVLSGADIFIKLHSSSQWKRSDLASATALYPSVRLRLLRETVLLARKVGTSSIANVSGGLARRYAVTPAPDQLEQLQAVQLSGQSEQAFLKTATAEVDAFLSLTGGGRLTRVEVHLKGTDPTNGELERVDSNADFSAAKVAAITPPATSTQVPPSEILNPSA